MNYSQCLRYLANLGNELRGVVFELGTSRKVLQRLGNPHQKYPAALIAGTNGKGSTSAMLAGILQATGWRAGLYTSPHLIRVNERIQVDGRGVADEEFARDFTDVGAAVDSLAEEGSIDRRPSFFEMLTATAFLYFARAHVDFAVLEVGMGGRLDATNVVDPVAGVITNVELDHMEFLGPDVASIAREKAGIMRRGRPVISGCESPEAVDTIRESAKLLQAALMEIPSAAAAIANVRATEDGRCRFDLVLEDRLTVTAPLRGRFQVKNTALAVAAARCLIDRALWRPSLVADGLSRTHWPGRLETISDHPLVLLDGAHNPAAAREVAAFVRDEMAGHRVRLVYASMRDKQIAEICKVLFPLVHALYLTLPGNDRAATPEEILGIAPAPGVPVVIERDPAKALEMAVEASSPEDVVLVAGSLFLVGTIKEKMASGLPLLAGRP
jgi:dihydrofolate synthase/folylpolyglutamate synthase